MVFRDRSGLSWLAGLCGGRKRRQRWQKPPVRDINPPVQPKTARFYGVQPLFTEPSPRPMPRPMPTMTERGATEHRMKYSTWQPEPTYAYSVSGGSMPRSPILGEEKLERWLGESLRTIPEDGRFDSEDGRGPRPGAYLLSTSSPATTSHCPSTGVDEFDLIVQGTSEMSIGEDRESNAYARPRTSYTNATGQTSYIFLDDPYTSSHEAIQNFLAAMQARQSVDCSSMASEYTDNASWVFRPLQPAPKPNQPEGFYDSQSSSGGGGRSSSTYSRTGMSEISTELAFATGQNSEYGEQQIVLRRMHSSSTFRSRFGSRRGDRNSMFSVIAGTPDPPMPSAQIPRRTISIRAVRRKLLEPQATGNRGFSLYIPLRDQPPVQSLGCQCPSRGPEVRMAGEPVASDVSRVHHWLTGQQQQYQEVPARPSEFLVPYTSVYPRWKPLKRVSGSYTFGGGSSVWGDGGSVYGHEETYDSRAQGPRMLHGGNCPCYDDTLVPVYQEVYPNSGFDR